MPNKNMQGKYSRKETPGRKKNPVILRILLAIVAVLVVIVVGMLFVLRSDVAENDFQTLSAQVQEKNVGQATETQTQSLATETVVTEPMETTPTETEPKVILEQYAELYQQNNDLFGWIKIEDTKIDYPVMHAPTEKEKYLHANFQGEYSYPGTPFLDETATADSDNLLIYAHNMPNESMFRHLMKYQEKNFWESHPTITFNTLYEEQEFEVLAAFYDRVYYKTEDVFKFYQFIDAEDEEDYDNAIAQFKDKALYDTGVTAEYGDQLITLVTCAYHTDNGRFVVVARKK